MYLRVVTFAIFSAELIFFSADSSRSCQDLAQRNEKSRVYVRCCALTEGAAHFTLIIFK